MLNTSYKMLVGCFWLIALASCTKESTKDTNIDDAPDLAAVPTIQLISVNKQTVREYQDTLIFTVQYLDGDGDLGFDDADSTTIYLIDNRDSTALVFEYPLSPRAPQGSAVAVQGELHIYLQNPIRINQQHSSEQTTFSIRLRDRARHWSNTVVSPTITITS